MNEEFRLPDLGEGLAEAEIVTWLVSPGDTVTLNQPMAEVETAKAIVELPSPFAGTVRELRAEAGQTVPVGEVIIVIDTAASATAPDTAGAEESAPKRVANLVGYGAAPRASGRPHRRARRTSRTSGGDTAVLEKAPAEVIAPHDEIVFAEPEHAVTERPRSTPPVRALAKRLGVNLALVEPETTGGIITRDDVAAYAKRLRAPLPASGEPGAPDQGAPEPAAPVQGAPRRRPEVRAGDRETRTPIRGVRKHTAAAMVASAFTAPHVTCFLDVDVTRTVELVARLRDDRALAGHRIGILALVAKAVCLALRADRALNARWDEQAQEIVEYHFVNLGVAAATERGLIVPHIPDADALGLAALADAIEELAATARAGRTLPEVLTGGTFSITNFGVFGVDAGTPILMPGQVGILGLGAVRRRPWEHAGQIALREVLTLSLSFDHRVVDGEQGARFLTVVGDVLNDPGRAMLAV